MVNWILVLLNVSFLGTHQLKRGYKCYYSPSRKWFVSLDVSFFESQSYFLSSPISQLSFQGEPWCEDIPDIVPVSEPLLVVEDISCKPQCEPAIGNIEVDTLKEQGQIYVRDRKR